MPSAAVAAFTDLHGLQSIRAIGKSDQRAALAQVAQQFESFFIGQVLKSMRAATAVFAEDNPLNSNEMQFRQEMLDQQLGLSLSQGRGVGLAAAFARGMARDFGTGRPEEGAESVRQDADAVVLRRYPGSARVPGRALPTVVRGTVTVLEPLIDAARERLPFKSRFADKESFVRAILPHARRAAEKLGVDHRVLIAQAALETGWGQSILGDRSGRSSHNLFNIKAGHAWQGATVGVTTLEFSHGIPRPERAQFRSYDSFSQSFDDYVELLNGAPRYQRAVSEAGDPVRFVRGLQEAGYATDPDYADKVLDLLQDEVVAGAG